MLFVSVNLLSLSPNEKTVAATVGDCSTERHLAAGFGKRVHQQVYLWFQRILSCLVSRRQVDRVFTPEDADIVRRQITGGAEELLLANIVNALPTDVSSDGKFIVHDMSGAKTAFDVGLLVD